MDAHNLQMFVLLRHSGDEFRQWLDVATTETFALHAEGVVRDEFVYRLWEEVQFFAVAVELRLLVRFSVVT